MEDDVACDPGLGGAAHDAGEFCPSNSRLVFTARTHCYPFARRTHQGFFWGVGSQVAYVISVLLFDNRQRANATAIQAPEGAGGEEKGGDSKTPPLKKKSG